VNMPRIAIACSGLGHVHRGNETWAQTVAEGLHRKGMPVTLLGGGKLESACPYVHIPNWRRDHPLMRRWVSWGRRYLIEQCTFEIVLARWLKTHPYDVVHMADPALAWRTHRRLRGTKTRVIYQDGLLLSTPWCSKFEWVQVLAPHYREVAAAAGVPTQRWFVIPQLVEPRNFAVPTCRDDIRAEVLGERLPPTSLAVIAVGDMSPEAQKRLDWLVAEVQKIPSDHEVHLMVIGNAHGAGATTFIDESRRKLGARFHPFTNVPAAEMPRYYQTADVFAHAALREPFGIVFVEAMACGLPAVGHTFPVTQWIIGEGGAIVDMTRPGALSELLVHWHEHPEQRRQLGLKARGRVEQVFALDRVIPLYQSMYEAVVEG